MDQRQRDEAIRSYYARHFDEGERLTTRSAGGRVEFERVRRIVGARLAPASRVLDVGGATGIHARWLAELGHEVTLVDPVPEQVEAAARHGEFRALVGDARALAFEDGSFDAVLAFGPLYHLQERADRLRALAEAHRVLAPDGVLFASGISRLAAATKTIVARRFKALPADVLMHLLETGDDVPDAEPGAGFPGGHHHTAAELAEELAEVGFADVDVAGLEGPGGLALEFDNPDDAIVDAAIILAERAQRHPLAADLSNHLIAIARKP